MSSLTERLRWCFEQQDFAGLHELYAEDAVLELHVGADRDVHRGRPAIAARYAQDFAAPATFRRWEAREAPWGAVVEAAALQGDGRTTALFRWVHLLTIDDGQVTTDTVYCTGATPAAGAADLSAGDSAGGSLAVTRSP